MFVVQPHAHSTTQPVPRRHGGDRDANAEAVEIDSTRLLNGQRELLIRHGSECYRLRHTRNDKLILTK